MEYKFTYSNTPIKIKYNKIVAIDTLDTKCLYKTFCIQCGNCVNLYWRDDGYT